MTKVLSISNLYSKKHKCLQLDGVYEEVMGNPEACGAWLIYGLEKNGKTWFSLMLADYLSTQKRVLYISAEEGTDKAFIDACKRAGLDPNNRSIQFLEYTPIDELTDKLGKRNSADVIFIDNVTIYNDELKYGKLRSLLAQFPNKLFIFIAHEERKEPYTSTAKLIKKLAKVIAHVEGLSVHMSGRVPGGFLIIDEYKAKLYHGEN